MDEREAGAALGRLGQERRRLAAEAGLPAYAICGDQTLARVARARPATLSELAAVKGVGHERAERWGEALLAALDEEQAASLSGTPTRAERRQAASCYGSRRCC